MTRTCNGAKPSTNRLSTWLFAAFSALLLLTCAAPSYAQMSGAVDATGNKVGGADRPRAKTPDKPAPDKPVQVADDDRKRGMKDAPAIIAQSGLPCVLVDARIVGPASVVRDGKTVKGDAYEVACQSNQGFFLTTFKDGTFGDPVNCNQAETLHKVDKGNPLCALTGNRINHYWLIPVVKTRKPDCNVGKARWIVLNANKDKAFYEIQCKNGDDGIFEIPNAKAADQTVGLLSCLKTEGTGLACEFSDHAAALKSLAEQALDARDDCEISDARYIGGKAGIDYYEVGCVTPPGFVMALNADQEFQSMIGCDKADAIGGCKFTDVAALKAEQKAKVEANKSVYADALSKAGIDCTGDKFLRFGNQTDSARDVVEFKCPEQPNGLLALIPTTKPDAKFESYDCFAARMMELACRLTTEADLLTRIKTIAKASKINADCDVSEVRYAFMTPNGMIVTELACVNKRGYIAVLDAKRTVFSPAVPCHIAATSDKVPEKCTIAGNGSNQAP